MKQIQKLLKWLTTLQTWKIAAAVIVLAAGVTSISIAYVSSVSEDTGLEDQLALGIMNRQLLHMKKP